MVDSCMGDKRKDINCGGLRKDTEFYSWLTVVWETKDTRYKLWWSDNKIL